MTKKKVFSLVLIGSLLALAIGKQSFARVDENKLWCKNMYDRMAFFNGDDHIKAKNAEQSWGRSNVELCTSIKNEMQDTTVKLKQECDDNMGKLIRESWTISDTELDEYMQDLMKQNYRATKYCGTFSGQFIYPNIMQKAISVENCIFKVKHKITKIITKDGTKLKLFIVSEGKEKKSFIVMPQYNKKEYKVGDTIEGLYVADLNGASITTMDSMPVVMEALPNCFKIEKLF